MAKLSAGIVLKAISATRDQPTQNHATRDTHAQISHRKSTRVIRVNTALREATSQSTALPATIARRTEPSSIRNVVTEPIVHRTRQHHSLVPLAPLALDELTTMT